MISQPMNREDQLLLACARTQVTADESVKIKTLAAAELDWAHLLDKVGQQRVLPLLYRNLNDSCPQTVPSAVMQQLHDHYYVHVMRSSFLLGELLKLLAIFNKNGLKALPFKGAPLALDAYGELALRQFGDLDLLIRKQDISRVRGILEKHGYRCVWSSSWEMHLDRQDGLVGVDVHWAFTRQRFIFPLDLDQAWERHSAIAINGTTMATLSTADHLLVRCQDAAKDFWKEDWPRLQHIVDVAELLRAHPQLDWPLLLKRAAKLRARGSLFLYLALAAGLLDAPLPGAVRQALQADPQIAPLTHLARQRLVPDNSDAPAAAVQDELRRQMFCLRLKEFLPFPPAHSYRMLYALSRLYYRPQAGWLLRLRYWLTDRSWRVA